MKRCWCGSMAEQLICNQQVDGSTPFTSSIYGSVPERPKGADCKSVVSDFGGPNPPAPTKIRKLCFRIFPFGKTKRVDSEGRPCPRQGKRQPCGLSLARGLPHCFRSVRARVDVRTIHPLPPKSESSAFGFFLSVTQSGWIRKGGLAAGKVKDSPVGCR